MSNLLLQIFEAHVSKNPQKNVFEFIESSYYKKNITYEELLKQSQNIAAYIQQHTKFGDRVLLSYSAGLDFIIAFLGCLYAGVIAVPAYPLRNNHHAKRFLLMIKDCEPSLICGTCESLKFMRQQEEFLTYQYIFTEEIQSATSKPYAPTIIAPDVIAFLQYTSGSTGLPKGVMITHANLLANEQAIDYYYQFTSKDISVTWLPMQHDMGLVGSLFYTLYSGTTNVFMSPATFIANPYLWLKAISDYRASSSASPNFGYQLCIEKVEEREIELLDLSSWNIACNGSEPIRNETLEEFADKFKKCGFKKEAFLPCYGMAETTLLISGKLSNTCYYTDKFEKSVAVSSGQVYKDYQLKIVDPHTLSECSEGDIGEIWINGPSVSKGYWNKEELNEQVFRATLSNDTCFYLRTGDLGYLKNNELYIIGRLKDLIILQGRNIYPQDIEKAVESCHSAIRKGCTAAFSVEINQQEQLIIVAEIERTYRRMDFQPLFAAIRKSVSNEVEAIPYSIQLLSPAQALKTTSGKIQRNATKVAYLENSLKILAKDDLFSHTSQEIPSREELEQMLTQLLKKVLTIDSIDRNARFNELGGTSLQAVLFQQQLQKYLGNKIKVSASIILDYPTLEQLTDYLYSHLLKSSNKSEDWEDAHTWINTSIEDRSQFARFDCYPDYKALKKQLAMLSQISKFPIYLDVNEGVARDTIHINGEIKIHFSGYNYLGMSGDPYVTQACIRAIKTYGSSVSASRIASGDRPIHHQLEKAIASFIGVEDSLVMTAGFLTNASTISYLFGEHDAIFMDSLAHNSIVYGATASHATQFTFPHQDLSYLENLLTDMRDHFQRVLIIIEGVYSADGDIPNLPAFIEIKQRYDALLMIDEAHSIGTIGKTGHGIGEYHQINPDNVDIWMGTLSKSLASCGGYIAGSSELIELLKYKSPGFVFSCGLTPANTAAALASLELCIQEPWRVETLQSNADYFRSKLKECNIDIGLSHDSPVVPVIVGSTEEAFLLSRLLRDQGIYCHPMVYPAVEENRARIRFFINCLHTKEQLRQAADTISTLYTQLNRQKKSGSGEAA